MARRVYIFASYFLYHTMNRQKYRSETVSCSGTSYSGSTSVTPAGIVGVIKSDYLGFILFDAIHDRPNMSISMKYRPLGILLTPDGRKAITTTYGGGIALYDIDMCEKSYKLRDSKIWGDIKVSAKNATFMRVSHNNKMFCMLRDDGTAGIWDLDKNTKISDIRIFRPVPKIKAEVWGDQITQWGEFTTVDVPIDGEKIDVDDIVFSSDDNIVLVLVSKHITRLFDVTTGQKILERRFHFMIGRIISHTDPKKFTLVSVQGILYTWHIHFGLDTTTREFPIANRSVENFEIYMDGTMVAYQSVYDTIVLRDMEGNGTDIRECYGGKCSMVFSVDGSMLIIDDGTYVTKNRTNISPTFKKEIFKTFDYEARRCIRFLFVLSRIKSVQPLSRSRLDKMPKEIMDTVLSFIRRFY